MSCHGLLPTVPALRGHDPSPVQEATRRRLVRGLTALAGLAMLVAALHTLRIELRAASWQGLAAGIAATAPERLVLALALTVLSYAVLTRSDALALGAVGRRLAWRQVAGVSFLAYAISHTVGLSVLSSASVRYRFYSRWGVTRAEFPRIVFLCSSTPWLGWGVLTGLSLLTNPTPAASGSAGPRTAMVIGGALVSSIAAYLVATAVRRRPLRVGRLALALPGSAVVTRQLILSMADWTLAGGVLYVLLPAGAPDLLTFLGAFLLAAFFGMVSHVPGGLGVFDGALVALLAPLLPPGDIVPALVMYRVVYYLLPFAAAMAGLAVDEARQRRAQLVRAGAVIDTMVGSFTPQLLATLAFVSGAVLLFSGATPASPGRLDLIARILPVGVVEASHFAASLTGVGLLILSHGLARRLDAAYYVAFGLVLVGIVASLFKGLDYEEALLLAFVFVALYRARALFDRRAAFFETRFSPAWTATLGGTVAASVWLGLFAFAHVEYANQLWWQFELHGEASRFLRASVGAAVAVAALGVSRLIGHAPYEAAAPTDRDLADAARVIASQSATMPNLAHLRDKALFFNGARTAFLMYAVQGRSWVVLGDPVGPTGEVPELLRRFLERCDDFGGVPVFYEVGPQHLHRYADYGLAFIKVGEEARVDLRSFSLAGPHAARHRQALRRLDMDGATFRVVPASDVPGIMARLRVVSEAWLRRKAGAEKRFSLGFFDEAYLTRFPVAVIERDGRVLAFSNLWLGADRVECSADLMRYAPEAPRSMMEALLLHVMLWGQQHGYQRFVLGMAPLSGFEQSTVAPLWHRLGAFLYQHGEAVYGFKGLRAYKEKFDPAWEPRYLAYRGGLRLPRILADLAALIAGGYARILVK